jgi:alkylhydroperoxidase/carboxymuconolactone decarboxylase family protein YurZ
MAEVSKDTAERLEGLATAEDDLITSLLEMQIHNRDASGLDPRTYSLVKIAALIALDAPPASYAWQIANALEDGVTPEDIVGVLRAVAPQVGGPRTVAAAAEIMVTLGLPFEGEE